MQYSSLVLLASAAASAVSAFNITAYSDRACKTEILFIDGFPGQGQAGCTELPAGVQSIKGDYRDFLSAYATNAYFGSCDCSGFGVGQANFLDADYPIADGQCVAAQQYNQTIGSLYFSTYR